MGRNPPVDDGAAPDDSVVMKIVRLVPILAVLFATAVAQAQPVLLQRQANEDDQAFAHRALALPATTEVDVTSAVWNGEETLFVDYLTDEEYPERPLLALRRLPSGGYANLTVTRGEQEGGEPSVAAIGFANADRDSAKELIVILTWWVKHYDVEGEFYEVRIFDDAKAGQSALSPLTVSRRFDGVCDCTWRDGSSKRAPFKTIASVKRELTRLGF